MTPHGKPRFPLMSDEEAHLRQALPMALCGRQVDGATVIAFFPADPPAPGDWFLCGENLAFRILRLDGQAVRMDGGDGPAMADLLDRADLLLCEIEAALGIGLDPPVMGPRPDAAALTIRIEAGAAQIDLSLSLDTPVLPTPAPLAPALIGHISVPARLLLDGPRLPPADAAALAPGDLLLIGAAPLPASLNAPGVAPMPGRVMPQDRLFRPDHR